MKKLLLIAILFAALRSDAQQLKPSQSGYTPVNGLKVYYEVYGEGRPLVLLHGAFMTIGTNWGELIPELSKTRKVIAIELQGHGHTPFSDRKLSFPNFASDVEAVMNEVKVDSADVVGYSLGGSVAYQLAIQSPKRIKKLVIISSAYRSSSWLPQLNAAFKTMKPEMLSNSPMQSAYEAVAPDKANWTKFLAQMLDFIKAPFDLGESNIAKITAPVLIIAGDNDAWTKSSWQRPINYWEAVLLRTSVGLPKSQLAVVPAQGHVSLMMQTSTILGYFEWVFEVVSRPRINSKKK